MFTNNWVQSASVYMELFGNGQGVYTGTGKQWIQN